MFAYLNKKISIPNAVNLKTVAWNNEQGWIATGGQNGLLKVLRMESAHATGNSDGAAKTTSLSMNQTLEGHSGAITKAEWNSTHGKLTTADENGLIIVWILYKGNWYEEMVNSRSKSVVAGMHWNKDGQRICIAYEDTNVIVGSMEGARLWGKELKTAPLQGVQWSPDSKRILFATKRNEILSFDCNGNFLTRLELVKDSNNNMVSLDYYNGFNGYIQQNMPSLAVCYSKGQIFLLRNDTDENPISITSDIKIVVGRWDPFGRVLAVAGQGNDNNCHVYFYTPYGHFIRSLKIPGQQLTDLSWDATGLKLVLTVDSSLFFATIHPNYSWAFAGETVAYTFPRLDKTSTVIVFWNYQTGERTIKMTEVFQSITSFEEQFALVVANPENSEQLMIVHSNSLGTFLDTKMLDFVPTILSMNGTHIVAANAECFFVWHYKVSTSVGTSKAARAASAGVHRKDVSDRLLYIDSIMDTETSASGTINSSGLLDKRTTNPIVCISMSNNLMAIARESGVICLLEISRMALLTTFITTNTPHQLHFNCNASRLALIDKSATLTLISLTKGKSNDYQMQYLEFERKDIWNFKWANDNPLLFAAIEKTRMYVFRDLDPEEPLNCSGQIAEFSDLGLKLVNMDEIYRDPEVPGPDCVLQVDTKTLRDTRGILSQVGLKDGFQYVSDNSHPRLWKLIAEAALQELDYNSAMQAFVRSGDYQGIHFVRRLQKIDVRVFDYLLTFQDKMRQKAEIAIYFGQFDVAERIYMEVDRKDLAIALRTKLGDWFRVLQLIKMGGNCEDAIVERAWNAIGDYYFERQRWVEAVGYYTQGRNLEKLVECYYIVEDYMNLERLMISLPESSPLLKNIACKFASVGMCTQAVGAYVKCGDVRPAIELCVKLNQWDMAIELAEANRFKEIEMLFTQYATHIQVAQKDLLSAVELYRKANQSSKAAQLLMDLAREALSPKGKNRPLLAKQLYVLAALELERYRMLALSTGDTSPDGALLNADSSSKEFDSKQIEVAWRGAEACHFLMLANRHYHSQNPLFAMRTAILLKDYEKYVSPKIIYSLIVLFSYQAGFFGVCSRALTKLEGLDSTEISETERSRYKELAIQFFKNQSPVNPKGSNSSCATCQSFIGEYDTCCDTCGTFSQFCIATGQRIQSSRPHMCMTCHRWMDQHAVNKWQFCALCHEAL